MHTDPFQRGLVVRLVSLSVPMAALSADRTWASQHSETPLKTTLFSRQMTVVMIAYPGATTGLARDVGSGGAQVLRLKILPLLPTSDISLWVDGVRRHPRTHA